MNYLLFYPNEIQHVGDHENPAEDSVHAVVTGTRAAYIVERHQINISKITGNLTIKAAVYGGKLGEATLVSGDGNEIHFVCKFYREPPARKQTTLIAAISRPQTVKKIIQIATSVGVEKLIFIRSEKTVASYCSSKVWETENIQFEVLQALEQVGDTQAPIIEVIKEKNIFCREPFLELLKSYDRTYVYDATFMNQIEVNDPQDNDTGLKSSSLILGPESGFSDRERQWFINNSAEINPKIILKNLGERVYRLEHATMLALSRF